MTTLMIIFFLLTAFLYFMGGLLAALAIREASSPIEWFGALVTAYTFPPLQWLLVAKHWKTTKPGFCVQLAAVPSLLLACLFGSLGSDSPWIDQSVPITSSTVKGERAPYHFSVPGKTWRRIRPEIVARKSRTADLGVIEAKTGSTLIVTCTQGPDGHRWDLDDLRRSVTARLAERGARITEDAAIDNSFDEGRLFLAESSNMDFAFAVFTRRELCVDVTSASPHGDRATRDELVRAIRSFAPD